MAINLDYVVQAYNAVRNARAVRRHAYEAEDAKLEEDQDKIKVLLLQLLQAQGARSIATDHGTVFTTEKIRPSAADWGAIWEWAKNNDGFEIVEKRLKTTFIKQYMEENEGRLPPGINAHRELEVNVRRTGDQNTNP